MTEPREWAERALMRFSASLPDRVASSDLPLPGQPYLTSKEYLGGLFAEHATAVREECAKIAEEYSRIYGSYNKEADLARKIAPQIAKAIRDMK